jgi:hypothetical protein
MVGAVGGTRFGDGDRAYNIRSLSRSGRK